MRTASRKCIFGSQLMETAMFDLATIKRANRRTTANATDVRLEAYRVQWDLMRRALVEIAAGTTLNSARAAKVALDQVDRHRVETGAA